MKVTPDLRLEPSISERHKPANALKPTKDVYSTWTSSWDLSPTQWASPAGLLHSDLSLSAFPCHFLPLASLTSSTIVAVLGLTYGSVSSSFANKTRQCNKHYRQTLRLKRNAGFSVPGTRLAVNWSGSVTTRAFVKAGANISNQQLQETSPLENILLIIQSEFLEGNARTPLQNQNMRGKNPFILTFLKAGLRKEIKSCDQRVEKKKGHWYSSPHPRALPKESRGRWRRKEKEKCITQRQ